MQGPLCEPLGKQMGKASNPAAKHGVPNYGTLKTGLIFGTMDTLPMMMIMGLAAIRIMKLRERGHRYRKPKNFRRTLPEEG